MKVLNLQCDQMHVFEGWFASEEDFSGQLARALIHCPICDSQEVSKRLSAPRLNLGAARTLPPPDVPNAGSVAVDSVNALQQQWLMACRHIIEHTVDVGTGFAEEARKMHYGEAPERAIRGRATPQETHALIDEGIDIATLLLPGGLEGYTQ